MLRGLLFGSLMWGLHAQAPSAPPAIAPGATPPTAEAAVAPTKPEEKCSIEGSVFSVTGEALKKAHVVLHPSGQAGAQKPPYGATTDAAGHFLVENIEPGKYSFSAERNGFVTTQYGAHAAGRGGALLTLSPGQKLTDVRFKLMRQGVISGRVTDEDNEAMQGVNIACLRWTYMNGHRSLLPSGYGMSNDRGEFRVYGLAPGKYFVSATHKDESWGPAEIRKTKADQESYAQTFYPGSTSPSTAVPIDITPGSEIAGIDVKLLKTRSVTVSGKLTNSRPGRTSMVTLTHRDGEVTDWNAVERTNADAKGNFAFNTVQPGSYTLTALEFGDGPPKTATLPVEVGDGNVEGLSLSFGMNPDITGAVQVEGSADLKTAGMRVALESDRVNVVSYGNTSAEVQDDGTFTIKSVAPDKYLVRVWNLPDGIFMKRVRLGDTDATSSSLDLTKGFSGDLRITVSDAGGQIEGSVHDGNGDPAVGNTVVLVPQERAARSFYKQINTDQYGRYSLKGIAPGRYKLFAWDDIEYGAAEDPEFLKPFDSKGEEIEVSERAKERKDLSLIYTDGSDAPKEKAAAN